MTSLIVVLQAYSEGSYQYLDGRTVDGTVGLAPSTEGFSGTKWELTYLTTESQKCLVTFKCLGDIDGPRYLAAKTTNRTVGLATQTDENFTTTWRIKKESNDVSILLERCTEPHKDTPFLGYLNASSKDGTVIVTEYGLYWTVCNSARVPIVIN